MGTSDPSTDTSQVTIMKLFLVVLLAAACSARIAPLLRGREAIDGKFIIKFRDGIASAKGVEKLMELPFISTAGAKFERVYKHLSGMAAASLTPRALELVRKSDLVEYVEEDQVVRASAVASWGLDRIDQVSNALDGSFNPISRGAGVSIFIIDTGIRPTHNDFGNRAYTDNSMDFCTIKRGGEDCHGHGTHCSGTAGGATYGVASQATLYGVRVLNCIGSGSSTGVMAGIDYVASRTDVSPGVASMSLGGGKSTAENQAIADLVSTGKAVAVAAGNDNADACNYSPASAPEAITVGASDSSDAKASFSNYGSCLDIWAPGVGITSATSDSNSSSATWNGTSMACPHVAGAIAALLGVNPNLTPAQIDDKLQNENSIQNAITGANRRTCKNLLYIGTQ